MEHKTEHLDYSEWEDGDLVLCTCECADCLSETKGCVCKECGCHEASKTIQL